MEAPTTIPTVECGLFGVQEDFTESFQSLDERFIKNKSSTFFFQAAGNSMEPTICPGDTLVVDRSLMNNFHGKVCVVCFEGEMLCKRTFKRQDGLLLLSDNRKYKPILVRDSNSIEIWGVVTCRIGELNK